ncbi:GDYXXLXY domain-containing protein [Lewinella sp. 4G2]|uniref:GDYXXLXY domain-containing protein n=1 Tax=Lewinella sp. 4G2 TaxID=1803372 RepID=UPI0007B4858B|nr:GDYXXLXY domain-containing protein [Lewinella sp. 4G2]OAV45649.1 hypothetical protein A3850_014610 [Lewinella sp. 4G2]
MKFSTKHLILINLLILFGFLAMSISSKETLLKEGQLVLLELVPIDPRSLMQGDYMRLEYAIAQRKYGEVYGKQGYVVIRLDEDGVGEAQRYQQDKLPLEPGEILLPYRNSEWDTDIGANSYFFQEGREDDFAEARYGGLRVDDDGNSVLAGLYNEERQLIE